MARGATALSYVRIAKESSLAVSASSPGWFYPWVESVNVDPTRNPLHPRFLTGDRHIRPPVAGEHAASGRAACIVGPENFYKYLNLVWPSLTSSAIGVAEGYEHTFASGNTQGSFEMQVQKGYMEEWDRGGWVSALSFTVARNSLLRCDVEMTFVQQDVVTIYTMPTALTFSVLDPFTDIRGTMERDDGAVTDMDGFTLRVGCAAPDFKPFGSQTVTDIVPGKYDINWELTCAFAADTEFRRFLGDSTSTFNKAVGTRLEDVKLEWQFQTGQYVDAGLTLPYELKFTAHAGMYEVMPAPVAGDSEIIRSSPNLLVRYSSGDATDIAVMLRNTVTPANIAL